MDRIFMFMKKKNCLQEVDPKVNICTNFHNNCIDIEILLGTHIMP